VILKDGRKAIKSPVRDANVAVNIVSKYRECSMNNTTFNSCNMRYAKLMTQTTNSGRSNFLFIDLFLAMIAITDIKIAQGKM
jgi:hypothetical protein